MGNAKVNRRELGQVIAKYLDVEQGAVLDVYDCLVAVVTAKLRADGVVSLPEFGKLRVSVRAPYKARNPKTGESVLTAESKRIRLHVSETLLREVEA